MDENFFGCLSQEALEAHRWHRKAMSAELEVVPVLAAWSDVCGVSTLLERHRWRLDAMLKSGGFAVLSRVRQLHGVPLFIGVDPEPAERVLILNDGTARTLDANNLDLVSSIRVIFYVRDLFLKHYIAKNMLLDYGLGLRTVLVAGERCQYAPFGVTGESVLTYTKAPSDYGRSILEQQFVYNPLELQMNTGFALAYSLESAGTKAGLVPNQIYVEWGWLDLLQRSVPGLIKLVPGAAQFLLGSDPALSLMWDQDFVIERWGRTLRILRISALKIHRPLEGEEVVIPLDTKFRLDKEGHLDPKRP